MNKWKDIHYDHFYLIHFGKTIFESTKRIEKLLKELDMTESGFYEPKIV